MKKPSATRAAKKRTRRKAILAVDVGGSHVKVMVNRGLTKREFVSGPHLSAKEMVKQVKKFTTDHWPSRITLAVAGSALILPKHSAAPRRWSTTR
jgi:hypothetical protein